jgi:transcription antitermination factor NusG
MNVVAGPPWIAVQVRARAEKSVTRHLEHRGYECFLPLRDGVPLFGGYVFCRFARSAGGPLVTTPGVTRIVSFAGAPAVIDDDEIAAIRRALASGLPVTAATVQAGDAVSVVHGPLRGVRGTVLHAGGRRFLVLSITLLRRSVAVEVDATWVQPDRIAHPPRIACETGGCAPAAASA